MECPNDQTNPSRVLLLKINPATDVSRVFDLLSTKFDVMLGDFGSDKQGAEPLPDVDLVVLCIPPESTEWRSAIHALRARLPGLPVIAFTENCDEQDRNRIVQSEPDEFIALQGNENEAIGEIERLLQVKHRLEKDTLMRELCLKFGTELLIGKSEIFQKAIQKIPLIGQCDSPVLISGETGTGKELFARSIHYLGKRSAKPFVPVNSGAIHEQLLESELFGHVRGAFTDAIRTHLGLLHDANEGSLFLDEINTLSASAQVKLLRFLEDKRYKPLGSSKYEEINVRIIAAANVHLAKEVHEGRFREDLYYRINVITLKLPSLRERTGDTILLAQKFLENYSQESSRGKMYFCDRALEKLDRWHWPGNVRELKNVVESAAAMSVSNIITADAIALGHQQGPPSKPIEGWHAYKEARRLALEDFERQFLAEVVGKSDHNISRAARLAGTDRRVFQRLLKKYHL